MGVTGQCDRITRNGRIYPESTVRNAIQKANFDCNDRGPQWISSIETAPVSWSIRGVMRS